MTKIVVTEFISQVVGDGVAILIYEPAPAD
jgi:hypothetical protein